MTADIREILAANPALERLLRQFMALYDAAEVLDGLDNQPTRRAAAAAYLREVAAELMARSGIPDEFVQLMIEAKRRCCHE